MSLTTAIEIEVFESLQPGTKAQMFCYATGKEKNHCFLSEVFILDDDLINQILDCLRFTKSQKNHTRYFLKEWV